jgi:energy-coupling factor transporter ATPase
VKSIIEVRDLNFSYQNTGEEIFTALKNISLEIYRGELVALVGANGSGKTTFARHLNGLLLPTTGEVHVAGMDTRDPNVLNAIRAKVGMVFQFPEDQIVATSVQDDVAFSLENEGLSSDQVALRVMRTLREMGLWKLRARPPHLLSGGQMQRLALAGILARQPEIILMDEPTVMLDPAGRQAAWEQINRMHARGKTILLITHDMEEAARAQRVLVLHEGRLAFSGDPVDLFSGKYNLRKFKLEIPPAIQLSNDFHEILGGKFPATVDPSDPWRSIPPFKGEVPTPVSRTPQKRKRFPAITAHELAHIYMRGTPFESRALCGISLDVGRGSIHGLMGVTGSGKSTFMQHLNGIYRPQTGTLTIAGLDLNDPNVPLSTICSKVGLAFQNPESQFFNTYVGDEIAFAARQLNLPGNLARRVKIAMHQVGLDFNKFKDRPLATLSGGERRKVSLASILIIQPEVLVLDEPTAGLDPLTRRQILHMIKHWQTAERTIILSSQNLDDIAEVADSVTVLYGGKVALHGSAAHVFGEVGKLEEAGLRMPTVVEASNRLRVKGWLIPAGTIKRAQLQQAIRRIASDE